MFWVFCGCERFFLFTFSIVINMMMFDYETGRSIGVMTMVVMQVANYRAMTGPPIMVAGSPGQDGHDEGVFLFNETRITLVVDCAV